MALKLSELRTPLTATQARAAILEVLDNAGFPVTAWQASGAARAIVEAATALAVSHSERTAAIASQGYRSTATEEFLDELLESHFDEARGAAVRTTFDVDLDNASTGAITVAAEELVIQASNGQTYVNTTGWMLNAGDQTTRPFRAEVAGADGNIPAQAFLLVTPHAGLTATFGGTYTTVGADAETDAEYRTRSGDKWGVLRVTKVRDGLEYLALNASAAIRSVGIDDANPRGPGTVDVFVAGENATAGSGDVAAVQAAIDEAFFGQTSGGDGPLILVFAAPTFAPPLVATIYYTGTESEVRLALEEAWGVMLASAPIGGFDFSPGPSNIILHAQVTEALGAVDGVVSLSVTTPGISGTSVPNDAKVIVGTVALTMVAVTP